MKKELVLAAFVITSFFGCSKIYYYGAGHAPGATRLSLSAIQTTAQMINYPISIITRDHGDTTPFLTSLKPNPLTKKIATSNANRSDFTVALKSDGTLWSWGASEKGELGLGKVQDVQLTPVQLQGMANFQEVSAGSNHVIALKKDGTVWGWGSNEFGQLADLKAGATPAKISGLENIVTIAASLDFSLALNKDGVVYAWGKGAAIFGENEFHQAHFKPVIVYQNPEIMTVGGLRYTAGVFVIQKDGKARLWDSEKNWLARPAADYKKDASVPLVNPEITFPYAVVDVIANSNGNYYCLLSDGSVMAKGWNNEGELGQGEVDDLLRNDADTRSRFVKVKGIGHIISIKVIIPWSFGIG